MADDVVDYMGLYKTYSEKLDFIRKEKGYDDKEFLQYQKDIVGACIGTNVTPDFFIDVHIKSIEEEKSRKRNEEIKKQQEEAKKQKELEEKNKQEAIKRAIMIKHHGKSYNAGTTFKDKLENLVLKMKEDKRKWKAFAKIFAHNEDVKKAADWVSNNPQIGVMVAGLLTGAVTSATMGSVMFVAGAMSYYYDKVKYKDANKKEDKDKDASDKKHSGVQDLKDIFGLKNMSNKGER